MPETMFLGMAFKCPGLTNFFKLRLFICGAPMIIFSGCAWIFGLEDMEPKPYAEVVRHYEKKKIHAPNFLVMQDFYIDSMRGVSYKGSFEPALRTLQFRLFDNTGRMICQYTTCEGGSRPYDLLNYFPPVSYLPTDTTYTLQQELSMTEFAIISDSLVPEAYTIVIYTGTYAGIFGTKFAKRLLKYSKENSIPNVILMSTDYIEKPDSAKSVH